MWRGYQQIGSERRHPAQDFVIDNRPAGGIQVRVVDEFDRDEVWPDILDAGPVAPAGGSGESHWAEFDPSTATDVTSTFQPIARRRCCRMAGYSVAWLDASPPAVTLSPQQAILTCLLARSREAVPDRAADCGREIMPAGSMKPNSS